MEREYGKKAASQWVIDKKIATNGRYYEPDTIVCVSIECITYKRWRFSSLVINQHTKSFTDY